MFMGQQIEKNNVREEEWKILNIDMWKQNAN